MKTLLSPPWRSTWLMFSVICCMSFCFASNKKPDTVLKEQAESWMNANTLRFTENKGQMTDMQGKPVNDLLFKADAGGMDMYITKSGLSYVFIKAAPLYPPALLRHSASRRQEGGNLSVGSESLRQLTEDKGGMEYCRADMELAGASIKKENIIKENASPEYFNYYLSHCPNGILNVRSYQKITIKEIYPGID